MNRYLGLICGLWLLQAPAAEPKAILQVAPTLAELGEGWTTNLVVSLLDPLSQSRDRLAKARPPHSATNLARPTAQGGPAMGWGRFHYGRGDLLVNRGAYFVSIQRWATTNALDKAWRQWRAQSHPAPHLAVSVGEDAYWTETDRFHSLAFRRGLFHVVVECGPKSDHAQLIHLAEVIDGKITPPARSKPKPAATK